MKRVCEIIDDCGLNVCRTDDCVDKVNGYTCDCDEDHELMFAGKWLSVAWQGM